MFLILIIMQRSVLLMG